MSKEQTEFVVAVSLEIEECDAGTPAQAGNYFLEFLRAELKGTDLEIKVETFRNGHSACINFYRLGALEEVKK